jgi:glycosyltransferase involved in cell wall biosynthesis
LTEEQFVMQPLVSILIPAYNSENWISDTLKSALAQTWPRKEIIVVDDGSRDCTASIARRFESRNVSVISIPNGGAANARNHALRLSQGDYHQWLDADDLLAPDKIERQMAALGEVDTKRTLLSSAWAYFKYRPKKAHFIPNALWQDLSPADWLTAKMSENLHMQTATWLVSRELTEAAGPWDLRLQSDDDGEYFCRVLFASEGTRFVPEAKVFYREIASLNRVSYIGNSDAKKDSMLVSMKLHIQYLRSVEDSERTRNACLKYLESWYGNFYPERPDIVAELQSIAVGLSGYLDEPRLRWKYAWLKPIFGWTVAKRAQRILPRLKSGTLMHLDKVMHFVESMRVTSGLLPESPDDLKQSSKKE